MFLSPSRQDLSYFQRRLKVVVVVPFVVFFFIAARLYFLQIVRGNQYRAFANNNTLKEIKVPALRGVIRDRHGVPIASSRPAFDLAIINQYVRDAAAASLALEELAGVDPGAISSVWSETKRNPPFYPLVVARDVPLDTVSKIQARQAIEYEPGEDEDYDLQGIDVLPYPVRRYPEGDASATTIGYVKEASSEELKRMQKIASYSLGDNIGASGLEKRWELFLKGRDGYQQKIVNAVGKEVRGEELTKRLVAKEAWPGNDLVTTIDLELQKYAAEEFEGKSGALIAMDPRSGEIYALVSKPSFDPALFAGVMDADKWRELSGDPKKVFWNRALQATYPPGSTYKIVVATAALEEGIVTEDEKVYCPGYLRFGNRPFRCWRSEGHGHSAFHKAIVRSCDVYFYTMGLRLGVDRIAKYAQRFGFGKLTGIDIGEEARGLIPTSDWKERVRGSPWIEGETVSISIGQGYDLVTPLQNAVMIAAIANGGTRVVPTLSRYFVDPAGNTFPPPGKLLLNRKEPLGLSPKTIDALQKALAGVVSEDDGTARRLSYVSPVPIAGKTGTAQVVGEGSGLVGREYQDHSWFIAYAPVSSPEIVVSVLVEHGGHGSSVAAPIAGDVIKKYMELKTR